LFQEYSNKNLALIIIEENKANTQKVYIKSIIQGKKISKSLNLKKKELENKSFEEKIITATKKELINKAQVLKLKNVTFLNSVGREEIARYWSILDVSIVHLKKTDLFKTVIPSKIFESMAMGVPILHGVLGESASIIKDSGAGILVEPENPKVMAEKLLALKENPALLEQLSKQGSTAKLDFDRKKLASNMLDIISVTVKACK
jgi:glycosyltransferase involved in cell wall biosynthesis